MAKYEGRGKCDRAKCGKPVDVYSDKNGLAYYNCGPCGFRGIHRMRKTSEQDLATLDREAEEDGGAPPAPAPIPVKPAPAPAPRPDNTPPPPAPRRSGFLDNFSL
jgi:DNA-directed RNA polymerase subunit RPC12/RpoP